MGVGVIGAERTQIHRMQGKWDHSALELDLLSRGVQKRNKVSRDIWCFNRGRRTTAYDREKHICH
jgi:hypothetical protein